LVKSIRHGYFFAGSFSYAWIQSATSLTDLK
jgi:hypothetical protein